MSEPVTAREHALLVAALEALADAVAAEYEKARKAAEPVFAAKYADDANDRQMIVLPSGEKVGSVTIKAPPQDIAMDPGVLLAWAVEHCRETAVEEYILPQAVSSPEVIAAVKAACPDVVRKHVRPDRQKAMLAEIARTGGWLHDKERDEKEKVAEVTPGTATGAFTFIGAESEHRRARIMAEFLAGRLRDVVELGGLLALPAGGDPDA